MDNYRFYVPDLLPQTGRSGGESLITLPDDQAHHARSVLRLAAGETVVLFDGHGAWAEGKVTGDPAAKIKNRGDVTVAITGGVHVDPPPARLLTLATAVPKGDRAEWLVEQASQLNVATLQWLDCDRGVVKPKEGGQKIDKWRRLAVESAKQCGRTHVMGIEEPLRVEALLKQLEGGSAKVLWLEPREGGQSVRVAEAMKGDAINAVIALIGPEGGWSEREWHLLESAAERGTVARVRLTDTVLRIETACAAIAALVMSE